MTNIKYRMVVTLKGKSEVWLRRDTSGFWDDVSAVFVFFNLDVGYMEFTL